MLIVCPTCASSYLVDPATIGEAGRTVRCARCRTSWFAGGPEAPAEPAMAPQTAMAEAQARPVRNAGVETPPPPLEPAPAAAVTNPAEVATAAPDAAAAAAVSADPGVAKTKPSPEAAPAERPPVSGNEETVTPAETATAPKDAQAAEAAPVKITDAPPLAPSVEIHPDSADAEAAAAIDTRRRVVQARRKKSRRSSRWSAVILVLIAVNVAVVGARNEVVRYLPQTASLFAAIGLPVNLRNLKFENVKLSTEDVGGITMLTVQGAIVSGAGKAVGIPRLRFAVRNASGQEVYTWTMAPPSSVLEPGARAEFRSQIPVPKVDAADVLVRFLTPQDAGTK